MLVCYLLKQFKIKGKLIKFTVHKKNKSSQTFDYYNKLI